MAIGRWDNVVQEIHRIAGLPAAAHLPDRELLEAFVQRQDQTAFEVLVRRYGSMVFGVCNRVLRHAQDAEDAFQATFLVMVRKAASVRRATAIGDWLYGVAYRTALHARSRLAQRRGKESKVPPMNRDDSPLEVAARLELQALLDRELNRLPAKYRTVIVLCDLLGKTKKQAAEELRCPEGTVSSRLAHGRAVLKKRLARYGSALGVAGASTLLEQTATAAVPGTLYTTTVKAALIATGTAAAGLAPNVASLVEGVIKSMLITKIKPMFLLLATAALFAGVGYIIAAGGSNEGPAPQAEPGGSSKGPVAVAMPVVKDDAVQPKQDQKPRLRYGGKNFYDWREVLQTELKPELQIEAINALGAFGVNGYGDEATVAIIEVMKKYDALQPQGDEKKVLAQAGNALCRIGKPAAAGLAKELDSKNVNDRRVAISAVGYRDMFHEADGVVPLAIRAMQDDDQFVRNLGLSWFVFYPKSHANLNVEERKALVPAIVKVLKDKNLRGVGPYYATDTYVLAAKALARFGPDSKSAAPTLIEVLDNVGPSKPGSKLAEPVLDSNPLRIELVKAIGSIGPDAKEAVPTLIATAKDSTSSPLWEAVNNALVSIGKAAVPALLAGLKDKENPKLVYQAADILGKIGPDAKEAVPALIEVVEWKPISSTIAALGRMGSDAQPAVPALLKVMDGAVVNSINTDHLVVTIQALGSIGPGAKEAIPRLMKMRDVKPSSELSGERARELQDAAKAALEKIQK